MYFDLIELKIDGSLPAEHRHDNTNSVLLGLKLVNYAEETGQRSVNDLDLIAEAVADDDLSALDAREHRGG